ncbi:MAG: SusD/RagB family nutrient-binding outer membrane lipoprotein [Bacteroidales bacterium]|nr:SusD/RagB family nutrient-binding outer membrane lipoprotein [Bacteroidales bacterium]
MKNTIKFAILLAAFGLLTASCEDWLDVNTDPNNPTSVSPNLALPVAQYYTAYVVQHGRYFNTLGNMLMCNWSQSDGFSWYTDEFKYNVTSTFYDNLFETSYSSTLKQYAVLDQLGDGYDYYKAIGKIMKAYHFQLLVDAYGDVPYSEALGRSLEATPKYDDAETIYEDLIVQLTSAINMIKAADDDAQVLSPEGDDVMFGGDMDAWIKLANTVKLRILTRQSDMAGKSSYIQTEIAAINAEGSGYITDDVGVNPGFQLKVADKQNLIWDYFGWNSSGTETMDNRATCATDYVLNTLTSLDDPRIDYLYEKPATGHLGVPQGLLDYDTPVVDAYMPEFVSNIGPGILKSATQDAIIFTLAESYFNQAELANKGLITAGDGGQSLYESGITASFEYLGLDASDAQDYYTNELNLVDWAFSSNKIQTIITQKWIAVNGITAEQSWFDYSRTGYPAGVPIPLNYTKSTDRPVRLFYPASEYSSNGENVPAQNTPSTAFTDKIFWAK